MHIIRLDVSNFKRLSAVSIKPDGTLQQISGKNGAGKTSVLDSIAAALGGKAASPDRPIRDGEKRAEVVVDLGELVVTRRWKGERSELFVESKDGARYKSPQDVLDKLVGDLSFDPLAFTFKKPPQQAQILREIAGLDTTILDGQRKAAYDKRTDANRALKSEQTRLEAMPEVDNAPADPVSVKALLAELEESERKGREWQELQDQPGKIQVEVDRLRKHVDQLEEALSKARMYLGAEELRWKKANDAADAQLDSPGGDPCEIRDRIAAADSTNEKVRAKQARAAQEETVKRALEAVQVQDHAIEEIDARKAELLAGAKFPVDGLSVDGDVPTFNGVPLSQSSGAEQLRVSLAVAAALNPKLKVLLVRDGSLLDSDSLALVAKWAAEREMQVWIERVADGPGAGVLIEDGAVAGEAARDPLAEVVERYAVAPAPGETADMFKRRVLSNLDAAQTNEDGDVDLGGE